MTQQFVLFHKVLIHIASKSLTDASLDSLSSASYLSLPDALNTFLNCPFGF